ncbi:hypothetical protein [Aeoliella mucimassa]|uniref:PEP-CTERM protein-sorting domain-containing protein n=1 Tax=Aeoliella mucimassa TaxID=2527972 RepID=A0A518AN21_9BACT|nr:hypothetical protein [Aeoliella mucimassa]QDU56125.1 hypothetical protein Pan181_23290 [Aeoliella mucimassa]
MRLRPTFAFVLLGVLASGQTLAGTMASFTPLGVVPLDFPYSYGTGLSADGQTAFAYSAYNRSGSGLNSNMPVRWTESQGLEELVDRSRGISGVTTRSNSDGTALVGYNTNAGASGRTLPFLWTADSGYVELGLPHPLATFSFAFDVTDDASTVVGSYNRNGTRIPLYWTESGGYQLVELPAGYGSTHFYGVSDDGSVVIGHSVSMAQAFRWTDSNGFELLSTLGDDGGFVASQARNLSADGSVIVGSGELSEGDMAFRWTAETGMQPLGAVTDELVATGAFAVSGDGNVVGGSGRTASGVEGWIWDETHGVQSLRQLLVDQGVDMDDWIISEVNALSYDGSVVVGTAASASRQRNEAFIATLGTKVPEPPSAFLLLATVGGLAIVGRNRSRQFSSQSVSTPR